MHRKIRRSGRGHWQVQRRGTSSRPIQSCCGTTKFLSFPEAVTTAAIRGGKEDTRFYDIDNNSWSALLSTPAPYGSGLDAFCSGHAHDNLGGVIFQGGLVSYVNNGHGIDNSARYNPVNGTFTQFSGAAAHWYLTLVAGVNEMYIFPGLNTQPVTQTPEGSYIEKISYGATSWTTTGV